MNQGYSGNLRVSTPAAAQLLPVQAAQAAGTGRSAFYRGRWQHQPLRSGLSINLVDLEILQDLTGEESSDPVVSISIVLDGQGTTAMAGCPLRTLRYRPGTVFFLCARERTAGRFHFLAGSRLKLVELRFDPALVESLTGGMAVFHRHRFSTCVFCSDDLWLAQLPTPPELERAADALLACTLEAPVRQLYHESRALEMLGLLIQHLTTVEDRHGRVLGSGDLGRVRRARDAMLDDLEKPWTIDDLAREVGLSACKLKCGFRQLFGNSIYAWLQDQRMRRAAQWLAGNDRPVTDVALGVGYSNPSHFAKVFRRYYGVTPRHYRRQRCNSPAGVKT